MMQPMGAKHVASRLIASIWRFALTQPPMNCVKFHTIFYSETLANVDFLRICTGGLFMRNDEKNCAADYAPYLTPVMPYITLLIVWVALVLWAGEAYHSWHIVM